MGLKRYSCAFRLLVPAAVVAAAAILSPATAVAGPLALGQGAGKKNALGVFAAGEYSVLSDLSLSTVRHCGAAGDIPVPGNYLGAIEGRTAVWSPSFGIWRVCTDSGNLEQRWGVPGDMPVAGDFDGDGLTDYGIFRPQTAEWFILRNSGGVAPGAVQTFSFGQPGDIGLAEDFDGDGLSDAAVFRSDRETGGALWFVRLSGGGQLEQAFGLSGDVPVPADYANLGRAQFAVWRPTESAWYILNQGATERIPFGLAGDIASPIDIDNNGSAEIAVYRPAESRWYVRTSAAAAVQPAQAVQGTLGARVANHSRAVYVDRQAELDADGDRATDLVVVRPGKDGELHFLFHTGSERAHPQPLLSLGSPGDRTAFADYDGDGITDPAVVREEGGFLVWQVMLSASQKTARQVLHVTYGLSGDQLVTADFDGDRRSDLAVVRTLPDGNQLWIPNASGMMPIEPLLWGLAGDRLFAADADGDSKADFIAVRQIAGELVWFIRTAAGVPLEVKRFGLAGDVPLIGDFNGDGRAEPAVVRQTNGFKTIFIDGAVPFIWGLADDVLLTGNYFGLAAESFAVWRVINSQGFFFIRSAAGAPLVVPFGVVGDIPLDPGAVLATSSNSSPTTPPNGPPSGSPGGDDGTGGGEGGGQRLRCESRTSVAAQEGGFVWKPVAEADGKLVVLFGSSRAGSIRRAALVQERPEGDVVLETLRFVGNTNGGRPTFRAAQPGRNYPGNVILVRQSPDNSVHCIVVANPGQRYG